jgi:lipoprotein-anchoring transpeptidase ErfK/SrfK
MPVPIARPLVVVVCALVAFAWAAGASAALELGARGPAVERLSVRLAGLGYLPRAAAGPRFTRSVHWAVTAFQKYERIAVDGIVGPETRAALRDARRPSLGRGTGRRVAVSLGRQLAFLVARKGQVVHALSVSTGRPRHRTPSGRFEIFWRERRSWSADYGRWLPWAAYFLRGYAFHGAATVRNRPSSHGCVRVPRPFARGLYDFARVGTAVVIR